MTEKKLIQKFKWYREKALNACKMEEYNKAIEAIELSARIATQYYICYEDDELEDIISNIAAKRSRCSFIPDINRIVYYETESATDVLTRQYLDAIIGWGYEILYIARKGINKKNSTLLHDYLKRHTNVELCIIPDTLDELQTIDFIVNAVCEYRPFMAFLSVNASRDVQGIIAWSSLCEVKRYYIETSDHTFWLGAKQFDYYISFRSQGYNTAIDYRGISEDKIIVQQYYPIQSSENYQGIEETVKDSVKILSGARLEKIYGQNDKFFELIEKVLKNNPNVEFYFAGAAVRGKAARMGYLKKQIRKRNYGERFHVLGYRNDLTSLMQHMDIYMGTYPLAGALMSQIAASCGLPIVQFATDGLACGIGETISEGEIGKKIVFINSEQGFYDEISRLVSDKTYRLQRGKELKQHMMNKEKFEQELKDKIFNKRNNGQVHRYRFTNEYLRKNQVEVENRLTHDYYRIIVKSDYVRKYEPFQYIMNTLMFIFTTDKEWLFRTVKNTITK